MDKLTRTLRLVSPKVLAQNPRPTVHQTRVYALTEAIPKGKVTTYGAIAKLLSSHPRAVGQALRTNPFAPIVPCHRVVASDGSRGGFKGETSGPCISQKFKLLQGEGVPFARSTEPWCVHPSAILDEAELMAAITSFAQEHS